MCPIFFHLAFLAAFLAAVALCVGGGWWVFWCFSDCWGGAGGDRPGAGTRRPKSSRPINGELHVHHAKASPGENKLRLLFSNNTRSGCADNTDIHILMVKYLPLYVCTNVMFIYTLLRKDSVLIALFGFEKWPHVQFFIGTCCTMTHVSF